MEIKRLAIGMVIAMALMIGWQYLVMKPMYDRHPEWKKPGQPDPAVKVADTSPSSQPGPTTLAATQQQQGGLATTAPTNPEIKAAPETQTALLGSAATSDPTYALQVHTTSRGAGIDQVVLNQFWATVKKDKPYTFESPFEGPGNAAASRVLATKSITVNGQAFDLSDKNWVLDAKSDSAATYSLVVGPVTVHKTVQTRSRTETAQTSLGYEVRVLQTIENTSPQPVTVSTAINGPVPPVREIDSMDDRQVIAGYEADQQQISAVGHAFSYFTAEKPAMDLMKDKNGRRVTWFGASSVYFDAILRPLPAGKDEGHSMPLAMVSARALNPDEKLPDHRMIVSSMETAPVSLAPGERASTPMEVFFGPKQRSLLNNPYYSTTPLGYDATLSTNLSGCGTYCTFGWLINLLVALLGMFHAVVRDWGVAIILLVAVVRLCLHPITKKSQISMVKMGKMGPEIERLKKKYGDDKEGLNKAMMTVYKEQGATPVMGCLPIFLQMPIWVALYSSLQNTFELRHEPFLYGLTWIRDLAKPDRLFYFPDHPINFYFGHLDAINLLPILMAAVFWLQQKMTPKPPATTPEQQQQQKMMQWMSLLFPIFLYNGPAGLNLYIMTSTLVGIVESKRIRDHIKQREEAEKEGRIIVEPTRKTRRGGGDDPKGSAKSGGLAGWLADLQQKAEDMRRQQDRKK